MKRLLTGILALGLSMGTVSVTAAEQTELPFTTNFGFEQLSQNTGVAFYEFTGKIIDIATENRTALVESEDGHLFNFMITDNTYFISGRESELTLGDNITGYYDAKSPMPLIEPPQNIMSAVAVNYDSIRNFKLDRFDENGLSSDKGLVINVSDKTNIKYQDGSTFEGNWANRAIVVFYTITTRSIPPQTPPEEIVVLFERDWQAGQEPTDDENIYDDLGVIIITDEGNVVAYRNEVNEIVVEGNIIVAEKPYYNKDNVLMIPLRAVVEALDYNITWDAETQSVLLDDGRLSLSVGINRYSNENSSSIVLNAAPENIEGRIFVPLSFFSEVAGLNNAYSFEAQVVIDDREKLS